MEQPMRVKSVHSRKGAPGHIVVIEDLPRSLEPGDSLTCGDKKWMVSNIEYGHGPPALILCSGTGYPEVDDELTWEAPELLDRPLKAITLRQLLEAMEKRSKERQELVDILKDLSHAINHLELRLSSDDASVYQRMNAFKKMRETFNRIPPKWLHR
jgi:hypothetical protein